MVNAKKVIYRDSKSGLFVTEKYTRNVLILRNGNIYLLGRIIDKSSY